MDKHNLCAADEKQQQQDEKLENISRAIVIVD